DPFDSGDGDDRRGRVDPFRHVEGRGGGVALHARVARPRHRVDLHQAELAGPVDEARGDPFPGGVDAGRIRRNGHVRSHGDDTAVADQYAGVGELRTGDGIDRSTRDGNGLGEQQRDHRSLPGAGISPSSKSVRGWCAGSERSYASQPSLYACTALEETENGSPDHTTTSAILPGSSVPTIESSPMAQAGLTVIHRRAWSRVIGMPARCPAYMALAASWFSRWMPPGSSEWMIGRPPACWLRAAFCWTPSIASSLNPHQSAQTETEVPSLASRSAILYDSTAWWNERILNPNSCARSIICAISSARSQWFCTYMLPRSTSASDSDRRFRPGGSPS